MLATRSPFARARDAEQKRSLTKIENRDPRVVANEKHQEKRRRGNLGVYADPTRYAVNFGHKRGVVHFA